MILTLSMHVSYLKETFEKWVVSEQATSYLELKENTGIKQFINVAEKN